MAATTSRTAEKTVGRRLRYSSPELSTPPRRPSTWVHTASRICSSIGSAVLVTTTPPAVTVRVSAPAAWPASAAGSTCAPSGEGPASKSQETAAAGRSPGCALRASQLPPNGGATTGGDCWFAWREPTGGPAGAPPPGGDGEWVPALGPAAPGQPSANTAVTVTVGCWLPGETGTGEGAARPALGAA